MKRDRKNCQALDHEGWRVFRFWECEIEKDPIRIATSVAEVLQGFVRKSAKNIIPSRPELLKAAEWRAAYNTKA